MSRLRAIPPEDFYGRKHPDQDKIEEMIKKNDVQDMKQPKFMTRLLGPSKTWKIFKKQQDAIDCCLLRRNGLMPFAFEDVNGRRMFLAGHPKVFWALNSHRFFKNCNSYEVIREYSACKLYLDIEFEYEYNKDKNGERMLRNFLSVINLNLKKFFNVDCCQSDILDLDSSSDVKFSHHVIYEIKNVAFQHNYAVGSFVKRICGELKEAFECSSDNNKKLEEVSQKYNMSKSDLLEFFVVDRKGQSKLFIDEGVYTKNRHFRLLGSSKQSKSIPLKISKNNKYKANDLLEYFLDSLVTYFSWEVNKVLELKDSDEVKRGKKQGNQLKSLEFEQRKESPSLFLEIDLFINRLISPLGKIRRKVFFSDSSTIVYDISGFRYCCNIGREHKSNNIKFVVDLDKLGFYQKCYDPDCSEFRSDLKRLPEEIAFLFEDDSCLATVDEVSDAEFIKLIEEMENECQFEGFIADEDLEKVVESVEAMMDVEW